MDPPSGTEEPDVSQLIFEGDPIIRVLLSESKNEDFGDPDTTTLLPLDPITLEVLCRLNLPGVPITGRRTASWFSCSDFNQRVELHTGDNFDDFFVQINQTTSHDKALEDMTHMRFFLENCWRRGERVENLGNHALKLQHYDENNHWTKIIWVRWTSLVSIETKRDLRDPNSKGKQSVHVERLALAFDQAMKERKGAIFQVPKVAVALEQSDISLFREIGQTGLIHVAFQPQTHPDRQFTVTESEDTTKSYGDELDEGGNVFEFAYRPSEPNICTCGREVLAWQPSYHTHHDLTEEGIFLRYKQRGVAELTILVAHESSLWPTEKKFALTDLVASQH